MRTGRPKDKSKSINRRHTIILTPKAEMLLRELYKIRPDSSWIHAWVSNRLIRDFSKLEPDIIQQIMNEKANLVIKLKTEIADMGMQLEAIRKENENQKISKEMEILEMR